MVTIEFNTGKTARKYTEMECALIQLTGYDMEHLIKMLAKGYTLEPPKERSFEELLTDAVE